MKRGIPFKFEGKSNEAETAIWSEFCKGGKATVEQTIRANERNQSKRARLQESQSRIWVGK